ncbi:putative cytochrome P450 [Tothia fuscella]|uniref:Cytochrome P450 n=1 Tax=Tothia fuscella TaxID=1048955 RepID=A0A9P4NL28_9PEZI|nr:putative cytochrome P450 [Tothia fuscella]
MSNKLDKSPYFYSMLGNPRALFPTISASDHKLRRTAIAPFFSTTAVMRFRPQVQALTDRFCERIRVCEENGEPIPVFFAYRCLTVDIIAEYIFGKKLGLLEREDWGRDFYSAWRSLWEMSPLIRQLPWMMGAFRAMPRWVLALTQPKALEVVDMETSTDELTREVLSADPETVKAKGQPTVLWEVAHSDALPEHEKSFDRLKVEGNNILAAGFETTGATLAHLTYCILADKDVHKRLQKELEDAIPDEDDIPDWQKLEKLPYLNAVMKETLSRVAVGAYSRLPRVHRTQSMRYKDWIIPAGTEVGMSGLYVNMDPDIFQEPKLFKPERWLEPDAQQRLEPYITTFGKGTRACVGINLAYTELYTVIATLLRRFPDLRLHETTKEDVEPVADYFAGMWRYEEGKPGIQVMA